MLILLTLELAWSLSGSVRMTARLFESISRDSVWSGRISTNSSMFSVDARPLEHNLEGCLLTFLMSLSRQIINLSRKGFDNKALNLRGVFED